MVRKRDLLICIREDNYCIDTLEMINRPKIDEIVEVERIVKDEDGIWICLVGYSTYMYDVNCFRKLSLKDISNIINKEVSVF